LFSRGDLGAINNIKEYQSLKPTQAINLESPKINSVKRSRGSRNLKNHAKFTFKIDTINDNNNSFNDKTDSRKSRRVSEQKNSAFACFESTNNIKPSRTAKKNFLGIEIDNNKKSYISDNKSSFKKRLSKASAHPLKSEQNLNSNYQKDGVRNSLGYFAQEKKEDCKVQ